MLEQAEARVKVKRHIRSGKDATSKARKPTGPHVVHGEIR